MKTLKQLILATTLLLCSLSVLAQADGYRPMVRPGVKWVYCFWYYDGEFVPFQSKLVYGHISYEFDGQTEIDGKTYMKCWRTIDDPKGNFDSEPVCVAYVREADKKVYAVYDEQYIANVKYYHAGFYDYEAQMPYYYLSSGYTPSDIYSGKYVRLVDEFLIYDFNDIPAFYARHPKITYDFGLSYKQLAADEGYNDVITYMFEATEADPVTILGRRVNRHKLQFNRQASYQKNINKAPQQSSPLMVPGRPADFDHTQYVLDGYGMVMCYTPNGCTCPAALMCRSFISPMAMFRNPKPYSDIVGNCYFGFCHIEEEGQIVYKSDACDITESNFTQGGGDEPSGVGEVPVDDGGAVDGRTYDMQGRVVSDPSAPGIYVRDGQKILVK